MPKRPRSPRIDEDADADAITGLDLPPAAWTLSIEDLPASSSALATEEIGDGGVGPVTASLRSAYLELARAEFPKVPETA